jgi:predicted Zn-dependent protease
MDLRQELARASTMLDVGRCDEATALVSRVVAAEPDSSRAWCLLARAHLGTKRYVDAIGAANRAVALDPADEWPHRLASNALIHLGNNADALRAASEAAGTGVVADPCVRGAGGAGRPASRHRQRRRGQGP